MSVFSCRSGFVNISPVFINFNMFYKVQMTFADRVISFLEDLRFNGSLPEGIDIMNPFMDDPRVMPVVRQFYMKFFRDNHKRHMILGINPGRFGAGSTGIPFTDTQRLHEKCGLSMEGLKTFETSSVFVYDMIDAYGGPDIFYSHFYISAVSPLGFTTSGKGGKQVNYNYYDSIKLTGSLTGFIYEKIEKQLEFGISRDTCFCLGTGRNYDFIMEMNEKRGYFERIVPLEHPRFIMQYKLKQKHEYIRKYISELAKVKSDHNPDGRSIR
jgi:hypothetical protein